MDLDVLQCKYVTSHQNLHWRWTRKAENSKHIYITYYINNDIPHRLRYATNVAKTELDLCDTLSTLKDIATIRCIAIKVADIMHTKYNRSN